MIDIEKLKEVFAEEGYRFDPKSSYLPDQFHKIFVYQYGIKYNLIWWFETSDCHKYGSKDIYHCSMIMGNRVRIEFSSDVLDIKSIQDKAKQISTRIFFRH